MFKELKKYLNHFTKVDRSDDYYKNILGSEKKLELVSMMWHKAGDELVLLKNLAMLEFFEDYKRNKELSPEELFLKGSNAIIEKMIDISNIVEEKNKE